MKKNISLLLCLSLIMSVFLILPVNVSAKEADLAETGHTYSSNWREWSQGGSNNVDMVNYGCWVVAMSKMMMETGIAPSGFNPDVLCDWEISNKKFVSGTFLQSNGYTAPVEYANTLGKTLEPVLSKEWASDSELWNYINNDYYVIIRVSNFSHYVYLDKDLSRSTGTLQIMESYTNTGTMGSVPFHSAYSSAAAVYVYKYDKEPPTMGKEAKLYLEKTNSGINYVFKFEAKDNVGIANAYVRTFTWGQTIEQASKPYNATISNGWATVKIPESEVPNTLYFECFAEDKNGNSATVGTKEQFVSIYPVTECSGTFVIKAGSPCRMAPYEKVNGKDTKILNLSYSTKIELIGTYKNDKGNLWYLAKGGWWVYSGNVTRVTNIIDMFTGIFKKYKGKTILYHNGRAIEYGKNLLANTGLAETGSNADLASAGASDDYLAIAGTSPEKHVAVSSSGSHVCDHKVYKRCETAHPHYEVYACSVCGKEWVDTSTCRYSSTCSTCNKAPTASGNLLWPVESCKRHTTYSGHRGIDIPASAGSEVKAAIGGTVRCKWTCGHNTYPNFPSCCWGNGTGLLIYGDDGMYYDYAHMQYGSIPGNVYVGARVEMGQKIGNVGMTGCATGPHLHFQRTSNTSLSDDKNTAGQSYIYTLVFKPAAPTSVNLNNTALGKNDSLVASWGAVTGATKYNAKLICTTNSSYNQTKNGVIGTSASFTISNPGSYYVTVSASNSAGTSGETKSANATVFEDCTVKWVDYDNTLLLTETVKYNGTATLPPANPVREGYTFQGWDKSNYNIKQDTTIKATYKINTYTVSFLDYNGNAIGGMQRIEHGSSATPPQEVPTKAGYVFIGWNTDDYIYVKKNLTVHAVYEWENTDLPSILSIKSAVRNEEATGYNVKVNLANFPNNFTKGKLIVALITKEGKMVASETRSVSMPSEKEYTENVLVLYSGIVSTVEVSMVGVIDDDTTGTPKAKSVTALVDIGNKWSDWSTNVPSGNDIISESRTEYRYKDSTTIKATSQPATPTGYSYISSEKTGTYTDWGAWSGWITNPVSPSPTVQVETQTVPAATHVDYNYSRYVSSDGKWTGPWAGTWSGYYCGNYQERGWGSKLSVQSNQGFNIYYGPWYNEKTRTVTDRAAYTQYRYRTRSEYVNYKYTQTSFSDWQPTAVSASSTRQVETRTTYRFKTNSTEVPCYNYKRYKYTNLNNGKSVYTYSSAYPDSMDYPGKWEYFKSFTELKLYSTVDDGISLYNGIGEESWYKADLNNESDSTVFQTSSSLEDTTGVKRNIEGRLENAPGKVVSLLIYKGQNTDPTASQIEFASQTTTDENGNYRFTYITKEEPSIQTGDFVITIGVEGSTNYINIGKIEAPKPVYAVDFVGMDGKLISEENVVAGGTVNAPNAPDVTGYEFIGWDTALKNVQENMVVTAVYREKTCVVVFVDWDESFISMKEVKYGSKLNADIIPEKAGQKFVSWINEEDKPITTVTQNIVVTAKYEDATYTVKYLDADGHTISEQQVGYGGETLVPTGIEAPSEKQLFAGWDSDGEELFVTRDMVINPVFVYSETSESPLSTVQSGTYSESQKVGLYSLSANTKIYYYIVPSESVDVDAIQLEDRMFTEYKSPITVDRSSVVLAYAETADMNRSEYITIRIVIGDDEPVIPGSYYLGDTDSDGEVTILDATAIQRHLASLPTQSFNIYFADTDKDGEVTILDATAIQRFLADLPTQAQGIGKPIS